MRTANKTRNRRRAAPLRVKELTDEESGIGVELIRRLHRRNVERPVLRELLADLEIAKGIAVAFAGRNLRELPTRAMDSLRENVFIVLENSEPRGKARVARALSDLGWLVNDVINELWAARIASATQNLKLLKPDTPKERIA